MTETVMTAQEVFDIAVGGVLKQGALSAESGRCFYRGPNGLKCAVGQLLKDDEVNDELALYDMVLPDRLEPHRKLLEELQSAHDDATSLSHPMNGFAVSAARVAAEAGLEMVEVQT